MIVQMSTKSGIYHRDGCKHLSGIKNLIFVDIGEDAKAYTPCKDCCNLKSIYLRDNYKKTFEDLNFHVEFEEGFIWVGLRYYDDWKIGFDIRSQKLKLYNENPRNKKLGLGLNAEVKSAYYPDKIVSFILDKEEELENYNPYKYFLGNMGVYALEKNMEICREGDNIYILTEMAAWKIAYDHYTDKYKLLHSPFKGKKLTLEQAKTAHYHVQRDVGINKTPFQHIRYIDKHDKAKKIEEIDYKLLPQNNKSEKKYYRQAEKRKYKKGLKRVMDIFARLEQESDLKKYSIC